MKREVKFRGLRTDGKGWAYGFPYSSVYDEDIDQIVDGEYHYDVDPKTVGQFTGLHDKNGKEIYEGDVIKWGMHGGGWGHETWNRYAVVEINPDLQFRITYYIHFETGEKRPSDNYVFRFGNFAYKETDQFIEIIGNVFENADLVKL